MELTGKKASLAYKFLYLIAFVVIGVTLALVTSAVDEYRHGMYRQLLKRSFRSLDAVNNQLQGELWTRTGLLREGMREGGRSGEMVYHVEKIFQDMMQTDPAIRYFIFYLPAASLTYPRLPVEKKKTEKIDRAYAESVEKYLARYNDRTGLIEAVIGIPDKEFNIWGQVEMGVSPEFVQSGIRRTIWKSVLAAVVFVSASIGIAWFLLGNILVPIRRLIDAAASISGGDLTQRVPITTQDEIAALGASFNTMTDSLQHRIDDLNTVQAYAKDISSHLSKEEVHRTITRTLSRLSGADRCALLGYAKEPGKFQILSGINVQSERLRFPASSPLLSRVIETRQELIVPGPLTRYPEVEVFFVPAETPMSAAFLILPIVADNRVDLILILCGGSIKTDADPLRLFRALVTDSAVSIQNARLYELAITDGLTGVFLRRHFLFELERLVRSGQSNGGNLALIMLDIDHFKKVNDTYGHPEGDFILVSVADTLKTTVRTSDLRYAERAADMVGRYGGEEFIVLLRNVEKDQARLVGEKIRTAISERTFAGEKHEHHITISLGLSIYQKGLSIEDWISRADSALYASKSSGRNRLTIHES